MRDRERIVRLARMLRQVAPEAGNVESLASRARAPAGTERTDGGIATARATVEAAALDKLKLRREADLTARESFALEAIILPDLRPVALVQTGKYGELGDPWTSLNAPAVRNRLTPRRRASN